MRRGLLHRKNLRHGGSRNITACARYVALRPGRLRGTAARTRPTAVNSAPPSHREPAQQSDRHHVAPNSSACGRLYSRVASSYLQCSIHLRSAERFGTSTASPLAPRDLEESTQPCQAIRWHTVEYVPPEHVQSQMERLLELFSTEYRASNYPRSLVAS